MQCQVVQGTLRRSVDSMNPHYRSSASSLDTDLSFISREYSAPCTVVTPLWRNDSGIQVSLRQIADVSLVAARRACSRLVAVLHRGFAGVGNILGPGALQNALCAVDLLRGVAVN